MTNEQKEGNKLIAEFDGWKYVLDGNLFHKVINVLESQLVPLHELKYHLSWDWLMPIISKIEKMDYHVSITPYACEIYEGNCNGDGGKYFKSIVDLDNTIDIISIDLVHRTVVEFIKWYNQNSKIKET